MDKYAKKTVKVIIIANPANTNCLIAIRSAPSIPPQNFSCLARLDHERLLGMMCKKLNSLDIGIFTTSDIRDVTIFGNHSTTQVPHISNAHVLHKGDWKPIQELLWDDVWQFSELPSMVQARGQAVIKAQKMSSGLSAARAVAKHIRDWIGPIPVHTDGANFSPRPFSLGILTEPYNVYGIPAGIVFSLPCIRNPSDGSISIVEGYNIEPYRDMMDKTIRELLDERDDANFAMLG